MIGGTPPMATIYLHPWAGPVRPAPKAYDISCPKVTLMFSSAVMRPRCLAGAISPIYRGCAGV
jgi:hypothetical protein